MIGACASVRRRDKYVRAQLLFECDSEVMGHRHFEFSRRQCGADSIRKFLIYERNQVAQS